MSINCAAQYKGPVFQQTTRTDIPSERCTIQYKVTSNQIVVLRHTKVAESEQSWHLVYIRNMSKMAYIRTTLQCIFSSWHTYSLHAGTVREYLHYTHTHKMANK